MNKRGKLLAFGGILLSMGIVFYIPIAYYGSSSNFQNSCTTNFEALDYVFGFNLRSYCHMINHFETISYVLVGIGILIIIRFSMVPHQKKKIQTQSETLDEINKP